MLFTILLEKKGLYAKLKWKQQIYWKKRDCMLNLNGSNREREAEYHGKYI